LEPEAKAIARLALEASAGRACVIGWEHPAASGEVRVPTGESLRPLLDRLIAIIERQRFAPIRRSPSPEIKVLAPADLFPFIHKFSNGGEPLAAAAAIGCAGDARAYVLLFASRGAVPPPIAPAAELALRSMLNRLAVETERGARDFWQDRAAATVAKMATVESAAKIAAGAAVVLDSTVAEARSLRPRNRFSGLGAIIARGEPFAAWMLALVDRGEWRIAAVSGLLAPAVPLMPASAMVECYKRSTPILRDRLREPPEAYAEDRLFARFDGYLCAPFTDGAIALAARDQISPDAMTRVRNLLARLDPLIHAWTLDLEAARLRGLVRNLGLRMYAAAETERARIARDLHDHQAQLMAAARIALEAGPDEARAIFKQIEEALRLRVRELRPASLGKTLLADALRYELRRLAEADIKGRLLHPDQMNRLTRPLQELCYQVAREALSNVVRHAGATRVTVEVLKQGGSVRLAIRDNGHGLPPASATGGIGLKGLRERVELMGGKLRLESRPGATSLIAELTEL
jgi:signal transduction histidine kinase